MSDDGDIRAGFPPIQPRDIISPSATFLGFILTSLAFILSRPDTFDNFERYVSLLAIAVIIIVVSVFLTIFSYLYKNELCWKLALGTYAGCWIFIGSIILLVLLQILGTTIEFKLPSLKDQISLAISILSITLSVITYNYKRSQKEIKENIKSIKAMQGIFINRIDEDFELKYETKRDRELAFIDVAIELELLVKKVSDTVLNYDKPQYSMMKIIHDLIDLGILDSTQYERFRKIWSIRNSIVHEGYVDSSALESGFDNALSLLNDLDIIQKNLEKK